MLIDELLSLFWPSWHRRRHRHRRAVFGQVVVTRFHRWSDGAVLADYRLQQQTGVRIMSSLSIPAGAPAEVASVVYRDAAGNLTTVGVPTDPVVYASSDPSVLGVANAGDNLTASVSALKAGTADVVATQGSFPIAPAHVTVTAGAAVSGEVVVDAAPA